MESFQNSSIPRRLPNSQGRLLARYSSAMWLSGLVLPCLVIFVLAVVDWLGVKIPAGSPWPFFSLLLVALTLMMAGTFISDLSVAGKIGLAVLTICLFPCCIVLFTFLMAMVFGFTR